MASITSLRRPGSGAPVPYVRRVRKPVNAAKGSMTWYFAKATARVPAKVINEHVAIERSGTRHSDEHFAGSAHALRGRQGLSPSVDLRVWKCRDSSLEYVPEMTEIPVELTLIDLFCGAGGMSLGFVKAGFRPVALLLIIGRWRSIHIAQIS